MGSGDEDSHILNLRITVSFTLQPLYTTGKKILDVPENKSGHDNGEQISALTRR
jgi:hypothetical protein